MADEQNDQSGQADVPAGNDIVQEPAPESTDPAEQKRQYDELNDRFLRLAADFENFRKRTAREQERITRYANEEFAVDVLDIIDNLDRAARCDESHIKQGLVQIRQLCDTILQRHGITPIDSMEKPFDPTEHEAVAHVPSDKKEGIVVDEVCRGYRMHDKVIRFAKVAVSRKNEKQSEE
ncbi:MAG: heat shock protein GrpE [Methanoregula sp. PtaU1.Bin051]|nr:MAG: heat shock protein GrpE [Methanoregula sp. PtaU1.Bin051]